VPHDVKPADPNTSSREAKRLVNKAVDPKALQLGANELKNLANNALLVECKSKTDRNILEKELGILATVTVECPKGKLPTLILMFVPKEVEDVEIKDTILQQNNLFHIEDLVLNIKFTKNTFKTQDILLKLAKLRRELLSKKLHFAGTCVTSKTS
jgi:hypothetical protein